MHPILKYGSFLMLERPALEWHSSGSAGRGTTHCQSATHALVPAAQCRGAAQAAPSAVSLVSRRAPAATAERSHCRAQHCSSVLSGCPRARRDCTGTDRAAARLPSCGAWAVVPAAQLQCPRTRGQRCAGLRSYLRLLRYVLKKKLWKYHHTSTGW